ncbi:MAG TPA: hypothetical protein VKC60_08315 [Opitutaceae bacterium]|nr:hypothetical protein [Opitutaceae bacterium]
MATETRAPGFATIIALSENAAGRDEVTDFPFVRFFSGYGLQQTSRDLLNQVRLLSPHALLPLARSAYFRDYLVHSES